MRVNRRARRLQRFARPSMSREDWLHCVHLVVANSITGIDPHYHGVALRTKSWRPYVSDRYCWAPGWVQAQEPHPSPSWAVHSRMSQSRAHPLATRPGKWRNGLIFVYAMSLIEHRDLPQAMNSVTPSCTCSSRYTCVSRGQFPRGPSFSRVSREDFDQNLEDLHLVL